LHDNTPLGWAIVAGSAETVDLLLSRGGPVLTHYLADARRGVAGAFAAYAHPPKGAYERIVERLSQSKL
jgi:hypothetical protein